MFDTSASESRTATLVSKLQENEKETKTLFKSEKVDQLTNISLVIPRAKWEMIMFAVRVAATRTCCARNTYYYSIESMAFFCKTVPCCFLKIHALSILNGICTL